MLPTILATRRRFPATNSVMFRRIVFSACLAGLVAGLVLTVVQSFQVLPLINKAESYEVGDVSEHTHEVNDNAVQDKQHWTANNDVERLLWTAVANIGMAAGFALLLVAAFSLRGTVTILGGSVWGLAGFVVFFANPSLGMSPGLPGVEGAGLESRQAWWVLAVTLTAIGLALVFLTTTLLIRFIGFGLLFVPHLVGSPQPIPIPPSGPPEELFTAFFVATAIANILFWLTLGSTSAFFWRLFNKVT